MSQCCQSIIYIIFEDLILWLMFLSDGNKTLDQISKYLNVKKEKIIKLYHLLNKKKLVKKI